MKNYKGKEEMVVYETPFPKEISIGKKTIKPEIISDIPRASLDRETIGIVLGNPTFWDSTIVGKPSIHENVKQVKSIFIIYLECQTMTLFQVNTGFLMMV